MPPHEVRRGERSSVVILGAGPNRIGQGIEFDYCCVHAAMTVRESGRDAVMINCNPETVSTDYDTSDRLYFEPLTLEDVLGVVEVEQPEGVIVQFGGQTPLKLAAGLAAAGVPLLGTSVEAIDLAEDRGRFGELLSQLGYQAPPYATARSVEEALQRGEEVGFPLLVRPSYVLGGRAMEIVYSREGLADLSAPRGGGGHRMAGSSSTASSANAIEVDVDALCDGKETWVGGIMQHVEEAGVHSGDSACVLPPHSLGGEMLEQIREATRELGACRSAWSRPLNVQYAVVDGPAVCDRGQPSRSRTVPFVSKAVGLPLAKLACRVQLGESIASLRLPREREGLGFGDHVSVKEAVLPFDRFEGADAVLGPEMRSTGEVMGIARDFPTAFAKAQAAAGCPLPLRGTAFISVTDADKAGAFAIAQSLHDNGFRILATRGTAEAIARMGIPAQALNKGLEGSPHVLDWIERGDVDLVVNTPTGSGARTDGWEIRRVAVARGVPLPHHARRRACRAARAISERSLNGPPPVLCLQELHRGPTAERSAEHPAEAGVGVTAQAAPLAGGCCVFTGNEQLGAYRVLRVADPDGPAPDPGQFAMLAATEQWGGGPDERPYLPRALSIARWRDGESHFLLEDVGPGTHRLCGLQPGEEVWALGPLGVGFVAPGEGRRAVLVGGGAGIAPLAIWQDALSDEDSQLPTALLGFRDGYRAEGARLLRAAQVATDDGSQGHHGFVTGLLAAWSSTEILHVTVYACGPAWMLESVRRMCAEREVPAQLALESDMACGFGACFGCVVGAARRWLTLRVSARRRAGPRRRVRAGDCVVALCREPRIDCVGFCWLAHPVVNASGTFDVLPRGRAFGEQRAGRAVPARRRIVSKTTARSPARPRQPAAAARPGLGRGRRSTSIGLPNKGLEGYLAEDLPTSAGACSRESCGVPLITNVLGSDAAEIADAASTALRRGASEIAAIELNVSCPNVETGLDIGADPRQCCGRSCGEVRARHAQAADRRS